MDDEAFEQDETEWTEIKDNGFTGLVGPIFHAPFQQSKGRFRFVAAPKHRNRAGFVHGGMLMTFADRGLGMTARHQNLDRAQATVQLDMHFVRPARITDEVELRCRVIRETKTLTFVDGEMFVGDELVAMARGVWKIIRPGSAS